MHVGGIELDPNRFLQLLLTFLCVVVVLLYVVKNTASKYFEVDANFEPSPSSSAPRIDRDRHTPHSATVSPVSPMEAEESSVCANCGIQGNKKCSRCKSVRYCSSACQQVHWKSEHKLQCSELCKLKMTQAARTNFGLKPSGLGSRNSSVIALVPSSGISKPIKKPRKVLFPYDEFIKLYKWNKPGFAPCGLLNCGNSCFANVVLQCLTYTRPLVAYLLEKGHQRECRRNDWCFLCELERHVIRSGQSSHPFSPINILSRLPNIGGNLGYGRQEDAHEFMRFAVDTMQSVCLDEFGGEKAVEPSSQETTLVQHIFGGRLQSQVICTNCNKISNQFENMMDLTVEIHGDAASLEECLDQFTKREYLDGDNMYKCDGCNDYVKAWKRLTIQRAPNVLTIALKRFQSGRFGKLNKRVTFPETLDLSPYMSEEGDGADVYRLYAVVVHVDMLNASFFGHYICYTKDFVGNWYRIDDCKVASVELEEVLSQGAYMLLYSRVSVQPSPLRVEPKMEQQPVVKTEVDTHPSENGIAVSFASETSSEDVSGHVEDVGLANADLRSAVSMDLSSCGTEPSSGADPEAVINQDNKDVLNAELRASATEVSSCDKDAPIANGSGSGVDDLQGTNAVDTEDSLPVPMDISDSETNSLTTIGSKVVTADSENKHLPNCDSDSANVNRTKVNGSVYWGY